jgi:hypothetical protein
VFEAARRYLRERGEPIPATADLDPCLFAGHQPELFHPGVWVKNFALAGLAREFGGTAINLIVDSDIIKSTSLRVPSRPGAPRPSALGCTMITGTSPREGESWPSVVAVPFDLPAPEIPYEERRVTDPGLFASFADRVDSLIRPWGFEPILTSLWREVQALAERRPTDSIGEHFAAARRSLERAWGCHNYEVPLSRVCATESFARFAAHLLADLERFQDVYNSSVRAYRARHGLRSRNHPVPELTASEGWLEAPLWGWRRTDHSRRERLFLRPGRERTEIRAGAGPWPDLPPLRDPEAFVAAWTALEGHGYKVRSRALITTLYTRLELSSLFIHGIGGGKYDELTDDLIREFYGLQPPAYLVLSGTRRLPLPTFPSGEEDRRRLEREVRDLHWNPWRHLSPRQSAQPEVQALLQERARRVAAEPADSSGRRERFRALQDLTARLRSFLTEEETRTRDRLERVKHELAANARLRSREYSFCLFPEKVLRPFCTELLHPQVIAARPG